MKEIKNKILNVEAECLQVSCFDSIEVTDRTTFDSCVVNGLQVTFWLEDDAEERINKMFDLLFEGMINSGNTKAVSLFGNNSY